MPNIFLSSPATAKNTVTLSISASIESCNNFYLWHETVGVAGRTDFAREP